MVGRPLAAVGVAAACLVALLAGEDYVREHAESVERRHAAREVLVRFCAGERTLDASHGGLVDCARAHRDATAWPSTRAAKTIAFRYTPPALQHLDTAVWFAFSRGLCVIIAYRALQITGMLPPARLAPRHFDEEWIAAH